ncbi:hypothetical protein [Thalassomonas haliotis]|uniref:Uncharacterized protein n=1 Tax=Thalassomonas haliotis TaxID=485448 RepID=A0ABY7VHB8_9GAMM|nr:hypothetical protein [Thalassomonas haliotis]WDE13109.1 hypothetical protein H3N35_06595 [Thalassomonas haliotis]
MKVLSNMKFNLLLLVLLSLGGYFVFTQGPEGTGQEAGPVNKQAQAGAALPDFDQRKVTHAAKSAEQASEALPVDADFNADEVLVSAGQQLDVIINEYNQVLDDPKARKALEQRMQQTAVAYKKAILAKVRKGEI